MGNLRQAQIDAVDLTADVSGLLPLGSGGTNAATAASAASNLNVGVGSAAQFAKLGLGGAADGFILYTRCAVDGDAITGLFENNTVNTGGSTNETSQLRFGFGGDQDVARIVVGKVNDYTSGADENSFMSFYVDVIGTATEVLKITSDQRVGINDPSPSEALDVIGSVNTTGEYKVGDVQVVSNRVTGWGAPTGTPTRTTFNTSTVTLEQLAERVRALIDDATTHGLIGS